MNMNDLPQEVQIAGTERRFFLHTPMLAVIEYALTIKETFGDAVSLLAIKPPRLPLLWNYPGAVKVLDITFQGPQGDEAWLEFHKNPFFKDLWLATVLPAAKPKWGERVSISRRLPGGYYIGLSR